jgi:hypothetical protein
MAGEPCRLAPRLPMRKRRSLSRPSLFPHLIGRKRSERLGTLRIQERDGCSHSRLNIGHILGRTTIFDFKTQLQDH